jgi:Siphovirus Gp157
MDIQQESSIAEYRSPANSLVERAKSIKVRTFENAMDAADLLLDVKELGERITSRKEEITKPLNASLKSAPAFFKPLEEQCADAEMIVKDAVLSFHEKHWKRGKDTDNSINGPRGKVTLVERTQVQINDEKAIPPQFCSPDPAKIEHALKAGIEVPGAELITTYGISAGKN